MHQQNSHYRMSCFRLRKCRNNTSCLCVCAQRTFTASPLCEAQLMGCVKLCGISQYSICILSESDKLIHEPVIKTKGDLFE